MKRKTKGLSLLVLIITIIIMIVLASAVILSLTNNNPILKANETKVKTDMTAFKDEWNDFYSGALFDSVSKNTGYRSERMNIDKDGNIIYKGKIVNEGDENISFADIMPSVIGSDYEGKVFIANGEIYIDNREKFLSKEQQQWIEEVGVHVLNEGLVLTVSEEEVNLRINKKERIYAAVLPDTDKEVTFSMPENRVVKLLETGSLTADVQGLKEGTQVLKASVEADDGEKVEKEIIINVDVKGYIKVTEITISPSEIELGLDESKQLEAIIVPENAETQDVEWKIQSQEPSGTIELSANGVVKGINPGNAKIVAIGEAGDVTSDVCNVKVIDKTELTIDKQSITKRRGETDRIVATVENNTRGSRVEWRSDAPNIVYVDDSGNIECRAEGHATITATCNTKSVTCEVTVLNPIELSVEVPEAKGTQAKLKVEADTTSDTIESVEVKYKEQGKEEWTTKSIPVKDKAYSEELVIEGLEAEKTYDIEVEVKLSDGTTKKQTLTARPEKIGVESISIEGEEKKEVELGNELTLTATFVPDNATDKTVSWTSQTTDYLEIGESTGKITTKALGETVITAKSKDNESATATCTVEVTEPITLTAVVGATTLNTIPVEINAETKHGTIKKIDVRYKEKTEEAYTTKTITPDNTNTYNNTYEITEGIKEDTEYDIQVEVEIASTTNTYADGHSIAINNLVAKTKKVDVTSLTVKPTNVRMYVGKIQDIEVTIEPENATNKNIRYEIEDDTVVEVDENGDLKSKKIGETTVTVISEDNEEKRADIEVTVVDIVPNEPKLQEGMTPITFSDSGEPQVVEEDSADWYNYETQGVYKEDNKTSHWANAKTVDGSQWVWIPRYAYKIVSQPKDARVEGGEIDIIFLKDTTDTTYVDTDGVEHTELPEGYIVHPAFKNESEEGYKNGGWDNELTGIWVAKYEAGKAEEGEITIPRKASSIKTASGSILNYPVFVPNANTWNWVSLDNMYSLAKVLNEEDNPYGFVSTNADTHLMKNSEWGAVAYLSQSKYGRNGIEISKNSRIVGTGVTGHGSSNTDEERFNTEGGMLASSTGNMYGIYDLNGGHFEFVSGYIDNGHEMLNEYGPSLLNETGNASNETGKGISTKYVPVYKVASEDTGVNNYNEPTNAARKGEAIWETSSTGDGAFSWFGDYSFFPNNSSPLFLRGGDIGEDSSYTGAFYFLGCNGNVGYGTVSFREVVCEATKVTEAEAVAKIGTTYYRTLQDAFDASSKSSDSPSDILLLKDVLGCGDVSLGEGHYAKLYLQNNTISANVGHDISISGNLEIMDNGTIILDQTLSNNGTLKINECTIKGDIQLQGSLINNTGTFEVAGGELISSTISSVDDNVINNSSTNANFILSSGKIYNNKASGAAIRNSGKVKMTGGEVDGGGSSAPIAFVSGTIDITGGIVKTGGFGMIENNVGGGTPEEKVLTLGINDDTVPSQTSPEIKVKIDNGPTKYVCNFYDGYVGYTGQSELEGFFSDVSSVNIPDGYEMEVADSIRAVLVEKPGAMANEPELLEGMTPIKFSDTGEVEVTDSDDEEWYSYKNQGNYKTDRKTSRWANAQTKDGSQWVWIPRYAYKIKSQPQDYATEGGEIDILFMKGTSSDTYYDDEGNEQTDLPDGYIVHPAFTDESATDYKNGGWDEELTGIWVSKYEAGYAGVGEVKDTTQKKESSLAYTGTTSKSSNIYGSVNVGTTKITYPVFVPNAYTYTEISLDDSYNLNKILNEENNPYGLSSDNADSHLIKNSEWGAVAYLTQSKYGRNGVEVSQNLAYSYQGDGMTGCAGSHLATEKFNSNNGKLASSTGNMYGVYDLNAGCYEYMASYINNGNENLNTNAKSLLNETSNASNEKNKGTSTKYISVYNVGTSDSYNDNYSETTNAERKGEAIWETSTAGSGSTAWFGDDTYFFHNTGISLIRSGNNLGSASSNGMFGYICDNGKASKISTFRTILCKATPVSKEDAVAQIGEKYYRTLQEAFDETSTEMANPSEVYILKDILDIDTVDLKQGHYANLHLQSNQISFKSKNEYLTINGTLNIVDEGTINTYCLFGHGDLIITGNCIIDRVEPDDRGYSTVDIDMKNGTVNIGGVSSSYFRMSGGSFNGYLHNTNILITGGKFNGGLNILEYNDCTIKGGELNISLKFDPDGEPEDTSAEIKIGDNEDGIVKTDSPKITLTEFSPDTQHADIMYYDGTITSTKDIMDKVVPRLTMIPDNYHIERSLLDGEETYNNKVSLANGLLTVPNEPELLEGMTPIIFTEDGTPTKVEASNSSWYDYKSQGLYKEDNKTSKWANAMTKDGSQWVWIPRYAYKIVSQPEDFETEGGEIDIIFLKDTTDTTYVDIDGEEHTGLPEGYIVHPAFKDESKEGYKNGGWDAELTGIWVAKYEAGFAGIGELTDIPAKESSVKYTSPGTNAYGDIEKDITSIKYPVFMPNANSYNFIMVGECFSISKVLNESSNPYGFVKTDADTHLMKNSEWGALVYLTQSRYGRNGKAVTQRKLSTTGSGQVAGSKYNTSFGMITSTTGNMYGVYDLSGGMKEYVAGYLNNGDNYLESYGKTLVDEAQGKSTKYVSLYEKAESDDGESNYNVNKGRVGEAIWETSTSGTNAFSWFGNNSKFCYTFTPFMSRGGYENGYSGIGIFYFLNEMGTKSSMSGFRAVACKSTPVSEDEAVAKIVKDGKTTYYTTLQDAIDDATIETSSTQPVNIEIIKNITNESVTFENNDLIILTLNEYTINSDTGVTITNKGKLQICGKDGTTSAISSSADSAINNMNSINIPGFGEIKISTDAIKPAITNTGSLYASGAEIISNTVAGEVACGIDNISTAADVQLIDATVTGYNGIRHNGTLTLGDGAVATSIGGGDAIEFASGTINLNSGSKVEGTNGVYETIGGDPSTKILNIGENDGIVNPSTPVIDVSSVAVNNGYNSFVANFYDGYVKGGTTPFNYVSDVVVPDGYEVVVDSDENNYKIATLKKKPEIVPNAPELYTGMTPIKFGTSGNVITTEDSDPEWYSYESQGSYKTDGKTSRWANAQTEDGSQWVWIPRFAYKIKSEPSNPNNEGGEVDVIFLKDTSNDTYIDEEGQTHTLPKDYTVHPAFTDESATEYKNGGWDAELKGIWVAKYEAGYAGVGDVADSTTKKESVLTYTDTGYNVYGNIESGETKITYPVFVPNAYSYNSYICINDIFNICKLLNKEDNPYGFEMNNTDTHLMKNSEWGAVAYLTQSKYGRNGIGISKNCKYTNSTTTYAYEVGVTGYGNKNGDDKFNTEDGKLASTTGNMYGIYDLSGGLSELTSGYLSIGIYILDDLCKSMVNEAEITESTKYVSTYNDYGGMSTSDDNYNENVGRLGEAIWETSSSGSGYTSWYRGATVFPTDTRPFMSRGGSYEESYKSQFSFYNEVAVFDDTNYKYGFRPVACKTTEVTEGEAVAKIVSGGKTTYYKKLQDAFDAASISSTTDIYLMQDIDVPSQTNVILRKGHKAKLHLEGKSINYIDMRSYLIENEGELEIVGNGTISADGSTTIKNYGKLTINGGTIKGVQLGSEAIANYGDVYIKSGTVTADSYAIFNNSDNAAIFVEGGNVSSTESNAIYGGSDIIISGGNVTSEASSAILLSGDAYVDITSGVVSGKNGIEVYKSSIGTTDSNITLSIGEKTDPVSTTDPSILATDPSGIGVDNSNFRVTFKGGVVKGNTTFSNKDRVDVSAGYVMKETQEGNTKIATIRKQATATDSVAKIAKNSGTEYYATLQDAIDDATYGTSTSIELTKNITNESVTYENNEGAIVLSLSGHTINSDTGVTITNKGNLTILGSGTISSSADSAINNMNEMNIPSSSTTISTSAAKPAVTNAGMFSASNASISSTGGYGGYGISSTSTSAIVNLENVTVTGYDGIRQNGTLTMGDRAVVTSTNDAAIDFASGTINLGMGSKVSGDYGVYNSSAASSSKTLNIGVNDSTVDTSSPVIEATYTAVYNGPTKFVCNFYDGYVLGSPRPFDSQEDVVVPDGYEIVVDSLLKATLQKSEGVPNAPKVLTGMTPITFNTSGTPQTTTASNTSWYNYESQGSYKTDGRTSHWANVKTSDGSQWVWIPRFAYKITFNPSTFSTEGGEIDVIFLNGTTDNYIDRSGKTHELPTGYKVHPAFTNESDTKYENGGWDTELTGIWVAKYEAGFAGTGDVSSSTTKKLSSIYYSTSTTNVYGSVTTSTKIAYPVFVPNAYSFNYINLSDSYKICKALTSTSNPYGLSSTSADTHLMKNSEWGAVVYLAHSKYGRNGIEIQSNKRSITTVSTVYYLTGYGNANTSTDKFSSANGQLSSSTGNMYGVYDLNGGSGEFMAGYLESSTGRGIFSTNR